MEIRSENPPVEAPPRFVVQLEGAPEDGGAVRLGDFQQFLQDLQGALRAVEAEVTGTHQPAVVYRIVALSTGSARVELEAEEPEAAPERARQVVDRFGRTLGAVSRGEDLEETSYETLEALERLAGAFSRHVRRVVVRLPEAEVPVPEDLARRVRRLMGAVTRSYGSYRGRLEQINVHGGKPRFYIYPVAGPSRIQCLFRRETIPNIGDYLEKVVEARGLVKHRGEGPFPFQIEVESLEALPADQSLSRAEELVGSMPDLIGDMDTASFLRMLREDGR